MQVSQFSVFPLAFQFPIFPFPFLPFPFFPFPFYPDPSDIARVISLRIIYYYIVAKWCIIGPQLTINLIGNHAQCTRNSMVHFQPPSITPNLGSVTPLLEFWHIIVYTRLHVLWTVQLSGVVIRVRPSQLYNSHHCNISHCQDYQ